MTAAPYIAGLSRKGIRLQVEGDGLRVFGPVDDADAAILRAHKRQIVGLLKAAEHAGLPVVLVHRLSVDDLAACADLDGETLGGYLRLLDRGDRMDRGEVPPGFTVARYCEGCGPVWLWPTAPERLIACPWCRRRKAGQRIPRP